jgi:hypothetical protein
MALTSFGRISLGLHLFLSYLIPITTRYIACIGKKLGWEKGSLWTCARMTLFVFESLGRFEVVVDDDRGHN